jgi:hypothetical protein
MSSKTLAIVLHPAAGSGAVAGSADGAVVDSSIGRVQITQVFETPAASGMLRVPASGPFDRVVAALPAEAAAFRILDLPFRDRRRVSQAVGPALEEHVPYDLDAGVLGWDFAGSSPDAAGAAVLAAIAESSRIDAIRAAIEASGAGAAAERLIWGPTATLAAYRRAVGEDATFTAVDLGPGGAVVARFVAGRLASLRIVAPCDDDLLLRNTAWSLATLGAADEDHADAAPQRIVAGGAYAARLSPVLADRIDASLETLPSESPVEGFASKDWRTMTTLVGLILVAAGDAPSPVVDFESGASSPFGLGALRDVQDELRPLVRWGAAALALGVVAVGIDYVQLFAERRVLAGRAEQIYASAMPSPSGGIGRKLKMEMRLRELSGKAEAEGAGGAGSPLDLLAALSRDVPKTLDVTVDHVDHQPTLARVSGHAASFETVTKMQELLQKGGAFARVEVKDVHASVSGSGVDFLLELGTGAVEAGA